jgi:Tol biopolymer transport system component
LSLNVPVRELLHAPGRTQHCEVHVFDVETGIDELVYSTTEILLEAPNWHRNGHLILNGNGTLWALEPKPGAVISPINITGVPNLNNDHVLSPDHQNIYVSANDDWHIYRAPAAGGQAVQITKDVAGQLHFLHGVSFDETELAYVQLRLDAEDVFNSGRIHVLNMATGEDRVLVNGDGPEDGSEYSIDDEWIYFSTENFSSQPGHAQIARARRDGSEFEQLTFDNRVNWFPHQSLDGQFWVYLSYPTGTIGHPADLPVALKLVRNNEWKNAETVVDLFGGQGTINVNSWAPDSNKFAYVCYPLK